MSFEQNYHEWLKHPNIDKDVRSELIAITDNPLEIEDCFACELEFGTGGIRGKMGPGTNRLNLHTISRASLGLSDFLLNQNQSSCVIAYDCRRNSKLFAEATASRLADKGIKVYMFAELMPTPILSFAVRCLKCDAGVVITASHNPAEDNGYKVYNDKGCQITLEAAKNIHRHIGVHDYFETGQLDFSAHIDKGNIEYINDWVLEKYYESVLDLRLTKSVQPLKVVYSPLNGTGNIPIKRVLSSLSNIELHVVPEQELPDSNFTTCPYPNPENPPAMKLAIELAEKVQADLCLVTDPDCDRVGVAVRKGDDYILLNGNEVGVLLLNYICHIRQLDNSLPADGVVYKTIVTTDLVTKVAESYGLRINNVLTGFKFIGEQIDLLEKVEHFVFGVEESLGYLYGTHVRDKDAIVTSMLICDMASYYKMQDKDLRQVLHEIQDRHGYHMSELLSYKFTGQHGKKTMDNLMKDLRQQKGKSFSGSEIIDFIDYKNDCTNLPVSDVLEFVFDNNNKLIIRQSGTEAKIKVYVSAVAKTESDAIHGKLELISGCDELISAFKNSR